MGIRLFGFEINRPSEKRIGSFAEPLNDDGALNVGTALGGSYGVLFDLDGAVKSEAELVTRYRTMMNSAEIQQAVDEIINEIICVDSHERVVEIILDDTDLPEKAKKIITDEFERVLKLLDFSNQGYEIARRFYVDGRLNYHAIVDEENPKEGIKELRYLDPRKIRLIREFTDGARGINQSQFIDPEQLYTKKIVNEYYSYSESGFGSMNNAAPGTAGAISNLAGGVYIAKDAIVRITSGLVNENNTAVLSWLHNSYKPLNQTRALEDANIIYVMSRAPERRIFYVDVGSLPKAKAEQYLYDMMARHKNKVNYDPTTGQLRDERVMQTLTEDYWFPRRDGSRLTEVETLPASGTLLNNENLQYFQQKLYKSLNVPIGRLQPETIATFGRVNEMTREELKFAKFIRRIRARLSILFDRALEKQLILKEILSPEEWDEIKDLIRYDFAKDNYFEELKELEILRERLNMSRDLEENVGKYFSRIWVKKNIWKQTDEEIEQMAEEMEEERQQEQAQFAADNSQPQQEQPDNGSQQDEGQDEE